jgi:hypothetical protein
LAASVYRTKNPGAQQEIDRLGRVYNEAIARGDQASANAAHEMANKIRSAMGGVAGRDYDPVTGRSLGGQENASSTSTTPASTSTFDDVIYSGASEQPMYDPAAYINQLKEAERRSRIAALEKARTTALAGLETEKANIAPVYYDKRNQAAAASDVSAMNFAQYAAARGIKGAAGAMPEIYRQAGLQGQIGALDRAEANALANIERQRSGIESSYASDVAAAEADVESNAMQALIDQWNQNRQYELQKAALTGSLGDTRTLAGLEFDYSKSPSNPAVQAAILANRARELENTAKEIQNSYLPQTLKLEAQRLEQQVKAGSLDYDTALAQLNQIKAQTANYQRQANAPYSSDAPKMTQTERQNNATADAYGAVDSALANGIPIDQLISNISAQTPDLVRQGIDPQKIIDYAYSRASAYAQPSDNQSWYTNLDSKLGGWLPFGAPR